MQILYITFFTRLIWISHTEVRCFIYINKQETPHSTIATAIMEDDWLVVFACFGTRLFVSLGFPSLQNQLDKSVEFSTPMTSYSSLTEGAYLLTNAFSLYDGGLVHHTPILVSFMSLFNGNEWLISILYAFVDSIIAYQLIAINKMFHYSKKAQMPQWVPALIYVLNPLVLLSTISKSSIIFTNLFISTSIFYSLRNDYLITGISMAFTSYFSYYPIYLTIPIISILKGNSVRLNFFFTFLCTISALLMLSFNISGNNWNFIRNCYLSMINFEKLFPNLGLWWYYFIEMFEMFIPFYHAVFNLFVLSFILPFTIRFHKQSFYAFLLCLGWITLTKPYPTLGDCGFFLSFTPFFYPIFGYLKYTALTTFLFLNAIVLSPIFYYLWVNLGSGNSNFFYAISLVYALAIASLLIDLCWAMLRMEYDNGKPDHKLKVTQI